MFQRGGGGFREGEVFFKFGAPGVGGWVGGSGLSPRPRGGEWVGGGVGGWVFKNGCLWVPGVVCGMSQVFARKKLPEKFSHDMRHEGSGRGGGR